MTSIKNVIIIFILLTFSCLGYAIHNNNNINKADTSYVGNWQGKLNVGGGKNFRIVFHISEEADSLSGALDSPDQGAFGIPITSIETSSDSIRLNVQSANGYYLGGLEKDSLKITGIWNQNGMSFPLTLKKINKVEEVKRPQEPKKPYPYKDEEVRFQNKEADITLAGTLTLPDSGENFPAVILITGSGPQDRNEALYNHKPFLVLADYLTRRGIAVLRYDDRGFGESGGNFSKATTQDFVTDALAAVDYLLSRKEINPKEIGLIGHSEGGLIAPLAAVKSDKVKFIILMAGPGLPGEDILKMQSELILKANGADEDYIEKIETLNNAAYTLVKTEKDSIQLREKLDSLFTSYINSFPENERAKLGKDPEKIFKSQINFITSPWFKYFLTYDPRPTLKKVKVPVLAIDGSKDLQVPPKEDLDAISKALSKGGNKNFKVEELQGLNHLFQTANTGLPAEYAKIEETIAPKALNTIGDWILKTVKKENK
ncbi:MAG: alpha/beta fold hydrolase [Ignavibacteriaceae bacterium]